MEQEKIKATCQKCGYSWESKSKMVTVSCSSCGVKVKLREIKK